MPSAPAVAATPTITRRGHSATPSVSAPRPRANMLDCEYDTYMAANRKAISSTSGGAIRR
jgi:hypothetical protein